MDASEILKYFAGRQDAMIWTALCCIVAAAPLFIASLLVDNTTLALAFSAAAVLIQLGLGIMMTTTLSLLPPPHLRAQVVAVYLLCTNIVGLGGGPLVVALLSDHLFKGPEGLSGALVTLLVICAKNVGMLEGLDQWIYDRRARAFQTTAT